MSKRTSVAIALGTTLGVLLAGAACTPSLEPAPAPPGAVEETTAPSSPPVAAPEASSASFRLDELPRPALDSILPAPRTDATLDDVLAVGRAVFGRDGVSVVAHPRATSTAAYGAPDDTEPPILALDGTTLDQPAAWLVTAIADRWVQVLVPLGRGALPSEDPLAVNGRAVCVRMDDVTLEATRSSVVVDVSERTAVVTDHDGRSTRLSVGVGREGDTDTPRGLGSLVAFATNPAGLPIAVTSMQSTRLDGYDGAAFAAFAFHPDPEHGVAVGEARSNGCIRMDASEYSELIDQALPLGTPVWVVD